MRYLILLLAFLLPTLVFAQAKSSFGHSEGHIVLKPETPVAVSDFFPAFAKTLRSDANSTWNEKSISGSEENGELTHHRFAQAIDNIPVLGATVVLHAKQGDVQFATGKSYPRQTISSAPQLSSSEASRHAVLAFTQWAKQQQIRPSETDITGNPLHVHGTHNELRSTANAPRLVFLDRHYPRYTGSLLLAYEVEIGSENARRAMYIDAKNGKLITSIPLTAHNTVPGSVETGYYGRQLVMVEQESPFNYRLVDSSRGIILWDNRNREILHNTVDFPILPGNRGGMVNDVYYGSSRFYDLLKTKFNWLGVDGQGEFFRATVVDNDRDLVNAFWSGDRATFGGGSCHYGPLTTLDVVGHEFAHGITQRTSGLVYSGQSGALNEGMSDIYGKALELYEQPDQFNWTLGNRFADSEYARPFRSMEDPNLYNNPKVVDGAFWNDGAGVHTNSGPLGHWFYLLIEGGRGTNDLGTAYDVNPVSLDVAFNVAFQLNRDYLTETSGYQDAFTNCMLLVENLYGSDSETYTSFAEAWKAIGLPTTGSGPTTGPDLAVFSFNSNNAPYCHPEDSVELTVVLSNRGDDLLAGTSYTLTAEIDTETSTITRTFERDFLGGEVEFIDVMFPMSVTPGQYRANVTVNLSGDIDRGNDDGAQTVYVLQQPFVIEIDGYNLESLDCFADEREIYVNLLNRGCAEYTGPVVIDLFNRDNTIVKSINAGTVTLRPSEVEFVSFVVPYEELEGVIGMRYDVPNDPLPNDNTVEVQMGRPRLLTATDNIDLSDLDAERYFALDDSRGHLGRVSRSGRGWLATTGYYATPFRLACLEAEANLASAFDLSVADICVDFDGETNPKLAFDMQQFHGDGDPEYPGLVEVNRGVSVSTVEFGAAPVVLASRPDGVRTEEEVDLPTDHKGLLRFTFYNASGNPTNWETADPNLALYDYTLIDNIRLAGVSDVEELAAAYSIYPNPARDQVTVSTRNDNPLLVEIYNAIGVRVSRQILRRLHTFSTESWPSGMYQVRVSDYTGAKSMQPLVISRN